MRPRGYRGRPAEGRGPRPGHSPRRQDGEPPRGRWVRRKTRGWLTRAHRSGCSSLVGTRQHSCPTRSGAQAPPVGPLSPVDRAETEPAEHLATLVTDKAGVRVSVASAPGRGTRMGCRHDSQEG